VEHHRASRGFRAVASRRHEWPPRGRADRHALRGRGHVAAPGLAVGNGHALARPIPASFHLPAVVAPMHAFASALDDIFDPIDSGTAPGGSVAVEIDGNIVYSRGFGLASVESGLANSPRTRGRIGSTTKQFTCLAVMLLAECDLVDIDAPLRQWI